MAWVDLGFAVVLAAVVVRQLVLLLLAAPRPRSASPGPGRIDVVVPAYDEEATLEATLRSALACRGSGCVIVVDDGSTDGTARIARQLAQEEPRVELVSHRSNRGKADALQTGIAHATTECVATLDADTMPDPDALRWLLGALADPEVAAAACRVVVDQPSDWLSGWQHVEYVAALHLGRRAQARVGAIATVPGALAGWRRTALAGVGGFRGVTLAEDTDATLALQRAGHRVRYVPEAVAYTSVPATMAALAAQRRRWLLGNLQCAWRHRGAWGEPGALRRLALPDLWWTHLLVYALMPLSVLWWTQTTWGHAEVLVLGGGLLGFDLAACAAAVRADGRPWGDLRHAPLQRLLFPFVMGVVFMGVAGRVLWAARRGERATVPWRPQRVVPVDLDEPSGGLPARRRER